MRLRSYIKDKDFGYVSKWVSDERIHALWNEKIPAWDRRAFLQRTLL